MQERSKSIVKWLCLLAALLWIAGAGWMQWDRIAAGGISQKPEDAVSYRILRECSGTFQERTECAADMLRAAERQKFNNWLIILGILFGPPIVLYAGYSQQMHAIEDKEEAERQLHRLERMAGRTNKLRKETVEFSRQHGVATDRRRTVREAERDASRKKQKKPHRLLLISEDSEMVGEVTALLFESNYTVVGSDLNDALLGFDKINFDVVVSELHFANQNEVGGIKETLDVMRDRKKKLRVVCISPECAHVTKEQARAIAKDVGVDGMIGKPFETDDLIELLDSLFPSEDQDEADKKLLKKVEDARMTPFGPPPTAK